MKDFPIIDFHTHIYNQKGNNICAYSNDFSMPVTLIKEDMDRLGVKNICGSIINLFPINELSWEKIKEQNDIALSLAEQYEGFYVPGFHINPNYLNESLEEIERMHKLGVNMVGELVPYLHGWTYESKGLDEILDLVTEYNMIFSFHTIGMPAIFEMVKRHPKAILVAAHPGEKDEYLQHIELMKKYENYYLDLSGTGIFRHMMLAYGIKTIDETRFLFGTDYPICNPGVYVGGVLYDASLTDSQKEAVLYKNAETLLKRTENRFFVPKY